MIDAQTEEQAALYVLDVLEEQERRDFEARLSVSPELRERVRQLSAGLHAPFKDAQGPARMDLLAGIHQAIGAEAAASGNRVPLPARAAASRIPWAFVWGMAAALLLVLNLFLLLGSLTDDPAEVASRRASPPADAGPGSGSVRLSSADARQVLEARIRRLEAELNQQESSLGDLLHEKTVLLEENQEVKAFNAGWHREYSRLAARVLPFFKANDRMSRFTVIEMVDARNFTTPGTVRGFAELAGRFLTGEGNIAGTGSVEFVGPSVETAILSAVADAPALAAVSRNKAAVVPAQSPEAVLSGDITSVPAADEEGSMGFTVWRDDEQKGFLDLYNLPLPQAGEPFLWVRSSEVEPYVPVGYLPELENGTGSLFYSVEEPNFTPVEILITAEDELQPGTQPSGEVLLRGP